MEPRMASTPSLNHGVLVGAVIVEGEVKLPVRLCLLVDLLQEGEKLLMTVMRPAALEDRSFQHVEGGQQGVVPFRL